MTVRPRGKNHHRGSAPSTFQLLLRRDGIECFYCGLLETHDDGFSIEHLLSKSHGGTNAIENLVLAHRTCNTTAGNRSVAEKVRLRDEMRAQSAKDPLFRKRRRTAVPLNEEDAYMRAPWEPC